MPRRFIARLALAAIQGLNQKLEETNAALEQTVSVRDSEIQVFRQSVAELKHTVSHRTHQSRQTEQP